MPDRLLAATLIAATLPLSAYAQTAPGTPPSLQASSSLRASLPLVFEPNQGQADPRARFVARGPGYGMFLTDDDAVMTLRGPSHQAEPVRMRLIGASRPKRIEGLEPTGGVSSYFRGADPEKWRTGIRNYRKVRYQAVYPGVDEVFYGNDGRLEYDLIVAPGADASRIEVEYQGPKSIRIDDTGDLVLLTDARDLRIRRPKVYQQDKGGNRTEVEASFRLSGPNRAAFLLARYDVRRELVIDPAVEYSTYLGGSAGEQGLGIAVDSGGNAYVAGYAGSYDFPTTPGAFQSKVASMATGYGDAFIAKFNATGTKLIYATYLGGTLLDQANAIAVDSAGNAYVTGQTVSADFPVQNALQPRKTSPSGHNVAFITKLNASGTGLVYSTYLGGSATDQGSGIAVDASGNALVTGTTTSTDFPAQNAFQSKLKSINFQGSSAFVTKLSADGSSYIYSTFLGGSKNDMGSAITVDAAGNAYVVGQAQSPDFPTKNAFQPVNGNTNVFLTKLNPGGSALVYSTFLGGSAGDGANGVAVDPTGAAYVTGFANSNDFPTKNALFPTLMLSPGAFVAKFAPSGASLVYSTFITGAAPGTGIAADAAGNAYPRTRANLGHVRKRLRLYYETAGHGDLVVIRLERGSYAPLIAYNVVLGTVQEVGPERIAEALDVLYAVLRKLLRSDLSAS